MYYLHPLNKTVEPKIITDSELLDIKGLNIAYKAYKIPTIGHNFPIQCIVDANGLLHMFMDTKSFTLWQRIKFLFTGSK